MRSVDRTLSRMAMPEDLYADLKVADAQFWMYLLIDPVYHWLRSIESAIVCAGHGLISRVRDLSVVRVHDLRDEGHRIYEACEVILVEDLLPAKAFEFAGQCR